MGVQPLDVRDRADLPPAYDAAAGDGKRAARVGPAIIACVWNLLAAVVFVRAGWADALFYRIYPLSPRWYPMPYRVTPVYLAVVFAIHIAVAAPVELGLALRGCPPDERRRVVRWWAEVVTHQAVRFLIGASSIVVAQSLSRRGWLLGCALVFAAVYAWGDRLGRIFGPPSRRARRAGVVLFAWAWTFAALGLASRAVPYDEVGSPLAVVKMAPRYSVLMLIGVLAVRRWGRRDRDGIVRELSEGGAWTPSVLVRATLQLEKAGA